MPADPSAHRPLPSGRHSRLEDALALLVGVCLVSLGLAMFRDAGLLAGGAAGIALLLERTTGLAFGTGFFLLNLPFYWLAARRMGAAFTLKTFAAVALLSAASELQPRVLRFALLEPAYAALAGGVVLGAGFLVLFRHRASLGGLGVLALWLQERWGWRAGRFQMAVDACIFGAAFAVADARQVLYSVAGAVVLNLIIAINHRPGRYIAP
ncbi:YitT family protein [Xylophilus sp. Leaf220]|uniref:YitT family protein n=1 Tax=Xylophilus sp. Leaf220 TaxID=1735686 RepID=UPI000701C152|nr:YitT family protein [Xylophilus sp. Leaf220]KQM75201.1 hypothetical protein ASE76_19065 [Xylophilus sp. Leaf220]